MSDKETIDWAREVLRGLPPTDHNRALISLALISLLTARVETLSLKVAGLVPRLSPSRQ